MSTKPPPPCPPPRPDLVEADSSLPAPKQSRAAPPPIPLRTDLGEGANDDVFNTAAPKIPPATLPKRTGSKRLQGRPEISIISAQPMASTGLGAFAPFEQHSVNKSDPFPAPVPVASLPVHNESTSLPFIPATFPGPPTSIKHSTPTTPDVIPGPPTGFRPIPSASATIPVPPIVTKPAPAPIPDPQTGFRPIPSTPAMIPGHPILTKPAPAPIPDPPTGFRPIPSTPAMIPGHPIVTKPAPAPIPDPPAGFRPIPSTPAMIPGRPIVTKSVPAPIPGPPTGFKPIPSVPPSIPGPPIVHKPKPSAPAPIPGPPIVTKPAHTSVPIIITGPPTVPKPAPPHHVPAPIPAPPTVTKSASSVPIPGPVTPIRQAPTSAPITAQENILKPTPQTSPGGNSPSPQKISKSSKSRPPPQRPKSKPVCDPTLTGDVLPGNISLQSMEGEKRGEPVVPKRKKTKPNKTFQESEFDPMKDFGKSNSAFQDLEPIQSDDFFKLDEAKEMEEGDPSAGTSKKSKPFPTVIRTIANGKEITSISGNTVTQEAEDPKEVTTNKSKNTRPTIIKAQGKAKPPPQSKKAKQEDSTQLQDEPNTGNPFQMPPVLSASPPAPEPQQVKAKSKPTIIIPKTKKDSSENKEAKKTDNIITSPLSSTPESNKAGNESNNSNTIEQASKPKRIPSIIRPNRPKKDKSTGNVPQNSRGMPEGQSQDTTQIQHKLIPARKAPPRPSPPKPGPSRPGPPKRTSTDSKPSVEPVTTQGRTPPTGTVGAKVIQREHSRKAKAPRPETIGKDKESEDHKAIAKNKKKDEQTAISSVVTTKIEPSAIALYDYQAAGLDDLSFKAGDEIYLVKRINPDWYVGRCNDCEGMVPIKFVEIIEDLPPELEMPVSSKASSHIPPPLSTMALYDFHAQSHDELPLHAGDTVQLLEILNNDWLKGQCNGITGIFPSNFVDFTQDIKQKLLQQKKDSKPVNNIQENSRKSTATISSGPRCKAVYDYHTDNVDDLSFDHDDVIRLVERVSAEWLKGEVRGTTGLFPAAYVEIIEDLNVVPPTNSEKGVSSFPVATALHDYISGAEGDLSFKKGDTIIIVGKVNDEWLEGELNGQRGIFPSSFIENVETPTQSGAELNEQDHLLPKGRALYDFTGESDQELTFKAGDEILLLQQINDDWIEGELNNHIGQFPSAFVEILVPFP